jgi:hypothetical protein
MTYEDILVKLENMSIDLADIYEASDDKTISSSEEFQNMYFSTEKMKELVSKKRYEQVKAQEDTANESRQENEGEDHGVL